MASSIRPATRYVGSLNSSAKSDNPSSSAELRSLRENPSAITKKSEASHHTIFGSMVKKLVESKKTGNSDRAPKFVVAADFLSEDLKKNAKKGNGLSGLHKKLFKGSSGTSAGAKRCEESSKKALVEVKSNTRTLAMVLRSERELLSLNKEQGQVIDEMKCLIQEKNREVEKLKDLCLKQREEIQALKNAVLEELVEKQSLELKQAKQLIPSLQRQVTSLTGQLQSLAEVKADKFGGGRGFCDNRFCSTRTPSYDQQDADNCLLDDGDYSTVESPDDLFLKDLNPCLTPMSKTKSKQLNVNSFPDLETLSECITKLSHQSASKMYKSSNCCHTPENENGLKNTTCRSGDSKCNPGKQIHNKFI